MSADCVYFLAIVAKTNELYYSLISFERLQTFLSRDRRTHSASIILQTRLCPRSASTFCLTPALIAGGVFYLAQLRWRTFGEPLRLVRKRDASTYLCLLRGSLQFQRAPANSRMHNNDGRGVIRGRTRARFARAEVARPASRDSHI